MNLHRPSWVFTAVALFLAITVDSVRQAIAALVCVAVAVYLRRNGL